jgi:hypothetical protein
MQRKVLSSIEPSSKEIGLDLKSLWTLCYWKIRTHLSTLTTTVLRNTRDDQSAEENWQSRASPEATTTSFHEEHGGDGTDKERTTAYQGHVVRLVFVEAKALHQSTHEVRDGVDTGPVER